MKHPDNCNQFARRDGGRTTLLSVLTGIAMLGGALLANAAIAADTNNTNQQRETEAAQKEKGKEGAPLRHERLRTMVKASKFAGGIDVFDSQNKKIGKVKDAVVELDNGHIHYVVVALGSTLGKGGKLVAMPPEAFRVFRHNDESLLDVTEQKVQQLPALTDDKQLAVLDNNAYNTMYQTMGYKAPNTIASSASVGKLTDILKADVSLAGKDKASVKDVALDLNDGYAPYVIVGVGGVAGIKQKLVAVPTNAFKLSGDKKTLQVALSEAQLKNAPPIDNDRWDKTLADREVGKNVFGSFDLNPYWRETAAVGGVRSGE